MSDSVPFFARFGLAFRALFNGEFAARVRALDEGLPALKEPEAEPEVEAPKASESAVTQLADEAAALQLLALLQREGRLVDFLKQEVQDYSDEDIGAAARVVHEGCSKALKAHLDIQAIFDEQEGKPLTVPAGFDADAIKLTGNVSGEGPYKGTLRHKGWRATKVRLPEVIGDPDLYVLAPAEVEL